MIRKRWIAVAAVLALLVSAVAIAQVTLVTSDWSSGNLVFKRVDTGATLFTFNTSGLNFAAPGNVLIGGTALTPTATELNEQVINVYVADICTTTATYATLPHAGTLTAYSTNVGGSVDAATVVNLYLSAVDVSYLSAVTGGTITLTNSDLAGKIRTNGTITGGNTVTANSGVRVVSDGGCTGVAPATVSLTVTR